MANLDNLPPELILVIYEKVAPHHQSYSGRRDLINICNVNRQLNCTVRQLLFRNITITFSLQDNVPVNLQKGQPRAWETSSLVDMLQDSAAVRSHVKSLRLRFYLYPIRKWDDASFKSIEERLKVNTRHWGDEFSRRVAGLG